MQTRDGVGERKADSLESGDGPAERLALVGIVACVFECGAGDADRAGGHLDSAELERTDSAREAGADIADHILVRYEHIVDEHFCVGRCTPAHRAGPRPVAKTWSIASYREHRQSEAIVAIDRIGDDQQRLSEPGVGDEDLLAVQHEPAIDSSSRVSGCERRLIHHSAPCTRTPQCADRRSTAVRASGVADRRCRIPIRPR